VVAERTRGRALTMTRRAMNKDVLSGANTFRDSFREMLESVDHPFEECKEVLKKSEWWVMCVLLWRSHLVSEDEPEQSDLLDPCLISYPLTTRPPCPLHLRLVRQTDDLQTSTSIPASSHSTNGAN
jgi:hypothetical protein